MLDPHSHAAREITTLWWWMLVAAGIVFGGLVAFLAIAFVRRNREGLPVVGDNEGINRGLILLFGIAFPVVALIAVFTVANFAIAKDTDGRARVTAVHVDVLGRQWFWQIRYPGTGAVTANELHIPVGRPVDVTVRSADVIHSFWVPQLNRKIDMIPGETNHVQLLAEKPGRYLGQCAEYCGLQHAHMRLVVVAEPQADFARWEQAAARPQRAPTTAQEKAGQAIFDRNACASCHQIRGTSARAQVGPDLTHLASRATLGALTIPNTPSYLRRWIADPQHFKPGNRMPALQLSPRDYDAVAAYLRSLK